VCGDLDHHHGTPDGEDEFVLDTAEMRAFIAHAREQIAASGSAEAACAAIEPRFAELMADDAWLPAEYQQDAPESGMGQGIGQWLLFRAGDGSLALFSLVVPPEAMTPVHDHLAWGLVGLYRGTQDDEIYERADGVTRLAREQALVPGDFYSLIPPDGDIHRVKTTSDMTSVSIHLLTNDTGCIWRHRYEPDSDEAKPFKSGYVNAACEDQKEPSPA
jgi:predicted metal-dependent enzyme (double-stranded beta helix superfamily)